MNPMHEHWLVHCVADDRIREVGVDTSSTAPYQDGHTSTDDRLQKLKVINKWVNK